MTCGKEECIMNKEMDYIIEGQNGETLVVEQTNSRKEDSRERLKAARKKTGMTQKEFAKYFEFSVRALEEWERGANRIPMYLLKLIEYKVETEGFGKEK